METKDESKQPRPTGLMKLADAANILGIQTDSSIEQIKSAYRNLALQLYPASNSTSGDAGDLDAIPKFHSIAIAFTKLAAKQLSSDKEDFDEDSNSDDDIEEDDVHEMRAFMRMFMDLVGIFNEDRQYVVQANGRTVEPRGFPIPSKLSKMIEVWTSDDEECDDEDDDSELDDDSECSDDGTKTGKGSVVDTEADAKKKLKNQKKRAEKRRKLKEKKKAVADDSAKQSIVDHEEELRIAEEKERLLRIELFSSVCSGDFRTVESILSSADCVLTLNERDIVEGSKSGPTVLHCCVSSSDTVSAAVSAGRLRIASSLLKKVPPCDVSLADQEGRQVVHLAAEQNDAEMIALLVAERDARRIPLDVNAVCAKTGWTPLHYSADRGSADACKALLSGGAIVSVQAAGNSKAKGPTPLALAKQRLKKPSSSAHAENLEAVCVALSKAAEDAEKSRLEREQAKKQRDAFLAAEREKLLQKEQEEKELFEKRQKQLKEKEREHEDDAKKAGGVAGGDDADKAGKKKKKKDKDKRKPDDATKTPLPSSAPPVSTASASALAIASEQISRDELLDRLLGMGFPESECMAAISACGNNADLAISWLCERPSKPDVKPVAKTASSSKPSAQQSSPKVVVLETKESILKDKERSEELRRINRAWNMKAEDEFRKQELDKKAKSAERQQTLNAQQVPREGLHHVAALEKEHIFRALSKAKPFNPDVYSGYPYSGSPGKELSRSTDSNPSPMGSSLDEGGFSHANDHYQRGNSGSYSGTWNGIESNTGHGGNEVFREYGYPPTQPYRELASYHSNGYQPNGYHSNGHESQSADSFSSEITNALELSAGAREFVPLKSPPGLGMSSNSSPSQSAQSSLFDVGEPFGLPASKASAWPRFDDFRGPSPDFTLGSGWTPSASQNFPASFNRSHDGGLGGPSFRSNRDSSILPEGLFSGISRSTPSQFGSVGSIGGDPFLSDEFGIPFLSPIGDASGTSMPHSSPFGRNPSSEKIRSSVLPPGLFPGAK